MPSQTVNIPRDTTLQDTNAKLQAIAEIIGGNPMIAEKFSTESAYAAGEYCINDGEFEKFTAAKSAGAWDASKATETTVGEELTALNSTLSHKLDYLEMPYNSFVWDSNNKCFNLANPNFGGLHVIGFLVTPTNGVAIMSGYVTSNGDYLRVAGWITKTGTSIDDSYRFKCYAIGYY